MAREHQLTSGPSCFKLLSGKEIMPNMICGEGDILAAQPTISGQGVALGSEGGERWPHGGPFLLEQFMLALPRNMTTSGSKVLVVVLITAMAGCGHTRYLAGTTIPATEDNLAVVETIEQYRAYLIEKNIDGVRLLASKQYFEDGGTTQANDDYGYDALRGILTSRLGRVQSLRYDIEYQRVTVRGDRAEVDTFLNGAFELQSETGERHHRVNDRHRFELERTTNNKWRFLNGM
jgi:hypothetical protein